MKVLLTRRRFLSGLIAAPLLAGLYAWRVEPTWIEFVERDLPIANLPRALVGKTLAQVSDIHIGPQVDDNYIRDVFTRIAALEPDIVVHTGDFVTYAGPSTIEQAKAMAAHFPQGQLGTFAILGNHDYGRNWADPFVADQITHLLTKAGCIVLRNQTADVLGLKIVGLDDVWAGRFQPESLLAALAPDQPAIVLNHNPDGCDLPGWGGYRGWILSGHTHGGQCKPPFLPPPLLPVKNRRYTAGEISFSDGRRLYISRGVGHLQRVRFNTRPEVTVFRLVTA